MSEKPKWIFNHLGARAHYEMPRALQNCGLLEKLITDIWVSASLPTHTSFYALDKFFQRRADGIPDQKVKSFNFHSVYFELFSRINPENDWNLILKRNEWFQKKVAKYLQKSYEDDLFVLFSFAYTANLPFQVGKSKRWKTILYQMDPGLAEEKIVAEEYLKSGIVNTSWKTAPPHYWDNWKKECELSDTIMVNSEWSKKCLIAEGIDERKVEIIPLSYTPSESSVFFVRKYPDRFSSTRKLKVLFLGTLTVRKGIHYVLEAAKKLQSLPIEFILVGQQEFPIDLKLPNVKLYDAVSRSAVSSFYREADVFLFPTVSDGFGLTQLEALSWSLPVISTKRCGNVVINQFNGIVLNNPSGNAIADELMRLLEEPELLSRFSSNSKKEFTKYSTADFAEALSKIG